MIPTLALPALGAMPVFPGATAPSMAAGPDLTDFSTFLAASAGLAAPASTPAAPASSGDPVTPSAATAPSTSGNILPVTGLPIAADAVATDAAVPTPHDFANPPANLQAAATDQKPKIAVQAVASRKPAARTKLTSTEATQQSLNINKQPEQSAPAAEAVLPPAPHSPEQVLIAAAGVEAVQLTNKPSRQKASDPAPSTTSRPARLHAPLTEFPRAAVTTAIHPIQLISAPEARSAVPIRIEVAARVVSELAAAVPKSLPQPADVHGGLLDPAASALPVTPAAFTGAPILQSPPIAAPADRPLDFTTLLDRLVAAREAVQVQPAALTVAHNEFGPVQLRFRRDERGLEVTLASADPDFARAVAAAPPPVMAAAAGQPAGSGTSASGQRGEAALGGHGTAGQHTRSQHADGRDREPASQPREPAPRGTGKPARHRGIYA